MPAMMLFSLATLLPIPLIAAAAVFGGVWVVAAFMYMTLVAAILDEAISKVTPASEGSEFPAADRLSTLLALGHFGLLAVMVPSLAGDGLELWEKIGAFFAAGLFFGQVSNSNAHELIHRGSRWLHGLGKWVYISVLFGHHTSAHVLIHHRFVATKGDPNSARQGLSYYRFARRAWIGSFKASFKAETERMQRIDRSPLRHPFVSYVGGSVAFLILAYLIAGWGGLFVFVALGIYAQSQLLLSDYVQHYGLSRELDADGKPEPVSDKHSWDSPHWFTSGLMLNAPRHSDHHAHPARPYPALRITDAPTLPHSLPMMATLALYPRGWKRMMDPKVNALRAEDPEAS